MPVWLGCGGEVVEEVDLVSDEDVMQDVKVGDDVVGEVDLVNDVGVPEDLAVEGAFDR